MKFRNANNCRPGTLSFLVLVLSFSFFIPAATGADQYAVIATVAADWSSGAHSVVSVDPVGGPRTASNNLVPSGSDMTVVAYGQYFYRMERSTANNVAKFDVSAPGTALWQFSTEGSDSGSNPHDLVFVSEQKAYLLRYGADTAWIVNPSATVEADFKIGEVDLSEYADDDGVPEMHTGVVVGDKLYITLQRIDFSGGWGNYVYNKAYVAVFDTTTDSEVDTGQGSGGLLGIELPVVNPGSIQYLGANQTVYVQGAGQYGVAYTGGIAIIDPATYATVMLVDDGDDIDHPYGNLSGMAIVSADKGYFVGYAGWGDNTLYTFDPSVASPTGAAVPELQNINIAGMEGGVYTDINGMLWVCNQTGGRVEILDTATDTIDESVSTELNPSKVVFAATSDPVTPPDDDDDDTFGCFINTIGR